MKTAYTGELDTITIKEVMSKAVPRLCEEDPSVFYLDADLMTCIGTTAWAMEHKDLAANVGIAEANLMGIAAGMAAEGFKPIVHSFGPFISRRAFDQAFLSVAYAGNSVTILGSDPGVTAEYNGGTHMPFEDVALYREVPGAVVIDVSDSAMMEDVLAQCVQMEGLKYIRFGRKAYPKIYENGTHFPIGKGITLREGNDLVIFATGIMVGKAMEAAAILAEEDIQAAVVNLFTIKPLDEETVVEFAKKTGVVLTVENHNYIGGLYSAVAEVLSKEHPVWMDYVAVKDHFGEVGPIEYLEEQFGLTTADIVTKAKTLMAKKK